VGILAYAAASFARASLDLYRFFSFPPPNFSGPAYLWWAYDISGFLSEYYWTILYGVLFCLFCLGMRALSISKQSVRRTVLVTTAITILVTITVYFGTGLEQVLDPEYRNPTARNTLDFITFALIGSWYVLGVYLVQQKQRGLST
jgi:succinate dehydrogenase hydrophobic anchor subunit